MYCSTVYILYSVYYIHFSLLTSTKLIVRQIKLAFWTFFAKYF